MTAFPLLLLAGLLGAPGATGSTGTTGPAAVSGQTQEKADAAPSEIDALCREISRVAQPRLAGGAAVDLELSAEGPATDISGELRDSCVASLAAAGVKPARAPFDRTIHVRVRVAAPSLMALVDVSTPSGAVGSDVVSVPLGPALQSWLSSSGQGLETWLAGSVEGTALSLCGADIGDQDVVAVVEPEDIAFLRWSARGLTPLARFELPPQLRTHARAPAASSVCKAADGGLTVVFGMHDRGKGGIVRFAGGIATWVAAIDGIPIGTSDDGSYILAEGIIGTNVFQWKGRVLAQAVASGTRGAETIVGATPDGALLLNDALGRPGTIGAGLALADLDHGGTTDLITTRPVFAAGEDGLSVRSLKNMARVRHQSRDLKELLGPVGILSDARGVAAIVAAPGAQRSEIYAVGQRQAISRP